mgnify:CR=1 FL=1|jgi:hypothetical protein
MDLSVGRDREQRAPTVCPRARMMSRRVPRFGARGRQRSIRHRPQPSALSLHRMTTGLWLLEWQASGCWLSMPLRLPRKFRLRLRLSFLPHETISDLDRAPEQMQMIYSQGKADDCCAATAIEVVGATGQPKTVVASKADGLATAVSDAAFLSASSLITLQSRVPQLTGAAGT